MVSAGPKHGLCPRDVACDPAFLPPVDDRIEPDRDPVRAAAEFDEEGKLGQGLLRRGHPRFERPSPEPGHGELGADLVVPREELPRSALGEEAGEVL
ncbi:MAG: hypothetical protein Kow0097_06150 [Candidatus Bipolaricaulota bacterium]